MRSSNRRQWLLTAAALLAPVAAQAVPIDLNLMYREADAPISVAADGSIATFGENPSAFSVYLSNIPSLGDPVLLTASAGAKLSFNYSFTELPGNADFFHFSLLDGNTGSALSAYELFFDQSAAGTAEFDLSALIGTSLGLQFELLADVTDSLFDSVLTISNVRVDTPVVPEEPPTGVGVPEPGTIALMLAGFGGLLARRRRLIR